MMRVITRMPVFPMRRSSGSPMRSAKYYATPVRMMAR